MKLTVYLFVLGTVLAVAYGQLIIDEDDPEGKKIIALLVKTIDDHEHGIYKYKNLVYTLGEYPKYLVYLTVTDKSGATVTCTVDLIDHGHNNYSAKNVACHK